MHREYHRLTSLPNLQQTRLNQQPISRGLLTKEAIGWFPLLLGLVSLPLAAGALAGVASGAISAASRTRHRFLDKNTLAQQDLLSEYRDLTAIARASTELNRQRLREIKKQQEELQQNEDKDSDN